MHCHRRAPAGLSDRRRRTKPVRSRHSPGRDESGRQQPSTIHSTAHRTTPARPPAVRPTHSPIRVRSNQRGSTRCSRGSHDQAGADPADVRLGVLRKVTSGLSKLGVGIIGVSPTRGWAATAHIPALRALPNYEIRALSAHSAESARAAGEAFGVSAVFSDNEQLVTQPDIDVVAVTVKVPHHRALVSAALAAGKAVYCEWPLGRDLEDTRAMAALAAEHGVRTVVGLQARQAPAIASIHVREAVAGGTGFLWEINGTDGTLRITADAAVPGIFPMTIAGAQGRNEPAELAVPTALTQKWPMLASLEGAPAFNVGRAYAAFAIDIANGTHTVPDFADAVRRHEVIAAIERSAALGERVKA